MKKVIDETIERARSLAFEISPPVLYELGLEPALEWLVRQFGRQYRLTAQFKDDGIAKPITDDARVFLFQSVRELLSNVTKHSRAKSIKVSACKDNNSICITIADDGIGFDTGTLEAKIAKNEGFGLFNVRERLRHINGQIEIRSKKGEGTSVILNVPLIAKQKRKKRR